MTPNSVFEDITPDELIMLRRMLRRAMDDGEGSMSIEHVGRRTRVEKLMSRGLLERHPHSPIVRLTERGVCYAKPLTRTHMKRAITLISQHNTDASRKLRVAITKRALLELAVVNSCPISNVIDERWNEVLRRFLSL